MRYILLPKHLLEFWYVEGIHLFVRTWKNLMLFLEEDLAVGLMARLLFVPLFHDASVVGRILSLLFRVSRILTGLFAFSIATIFLTLSALYWFLVPISLIFSPYLLLRDISLIVLLVGVGLFLIHHFTHPHLKVWQVKKGNFWASSWLKQSEVSFKNLLKRGEVADLLSNLEVQFASLPPDEITNIDIERIGKQAFEYAKSGNCEYIGPRHFFVASLFEMPKIDDLLLKLGLKKEDILGALNYLESKRQIWRKVWIWDEDFVVHHLKGVNRGWLGVPTPNLDIFGEDLTKKAAQEGFAPLVRESGVVSEIINILSQQSGRNVVVVGAPGSGKSALVRDLARQIVTGDAPQALATKRIVLLDLTKLLSGVKTQGDLADRVKAIFEDVEFAQNIIIVIEEIHELGMGEAGSSFNLYSLMQPYLESDTFQFVGTTEPESYARILEKNGSFARIFRKVELEVASLKDTLKILQYRSIEAERKLKVKTTFVALKAAVELSEKLIRDRVLPDSAIAVLKEAQAQAVNKWVSRELIRRVVSQRVRVPLMEVGNVDKERLLNLESEIHKRMIDQDEAVRVVSDALRRSVTGLREEKRPIGSFLFVGPTGVGKTELAKILSDVYFKTQGVFIRFDMSEYQNPESVNRLIGGLGEGGLLTEAVRNRPYALLLLDEFEKAHEKILTLFLQVLEDGRLTDGAGRTVDFSNTIIISTSNAGSLIIAQGLQERKSMELIDKRVNEEMLKIFKPELVNRFDDVVLFKPLSPDDLQKIVQVKLSALQNQMKEKGYLVEFEDGLVSELAKRGFDPILGARPLRRLIQDTLEAKLSRLILEGKLTKGETFRAGVDLILN